MLNKQADNSASLHCGRTRELVEPRRAAGYKAAKAIRKRTTVLAVDLPKISLSGYVVSTRRPRVNAVLRPCVEEGRDWMNLLPSLKKWRGRWLAHSWNFHRLGTSFAAMRATTKQFIRRR